MRVFVFMGERYYPRSHFGDLYATLDFVPTLEQLADLIKSRFKENESHSAFGHVEWLDLLIVPVEGEVVQRYFNVQEQDTRAELEARGFSGCFECVPYEDDPVRWIGFQELIKIPPPDDGLGGYGCFEPKPAD